MSKSYPDLEMLLSLSDLFEVSADSLLKEDEKLMGFLDNPRATKKQRIWHILVSGMSSLFSICVGIYILLQGKWTPVFLISIGFSILVFGIFLIIDVVKLVQVICKKENPLSRIKRLTSPAHKLENRRILAGGSMSLIWGCFFVFSLLNWWVPAIVCFIFELIAGVFIIIYTRKIRDVLQTHDAGKWK